MGFAISKWRELIFKHDLEIAKPDLTVYEQSLVLLIR